MGRSVSWPTGAVVAFDHFGDNEEWDDANWREYKFDLEEKAQSLFPSLRECGRWIGREDFCLLDNDHAYFGVSDYCGLVAIWIVRKPTGGVLGQHWIEQITPRVRTR